MPTVNGIRFWSTPNYTRVAIDLDDEVKYEAGRIPKPDRIFFDLHNAKLASTLIGKTFEVGDGFLRTVRVAPYQRDVVRIVLDVEEVADYSAFLLPNPYRLIIDIHGKKPAHSGRHDQAGQMPRPRGQTTPRTALAETEIARSRKSTTQEQNQEVVGDDTSQSETKRPETAQKNDRTSPSGPTPTRLKKSWRPVARRGRRLRTQVQEAKEQGKPLPKPDADLPNPKSSVKATAQPTTKPTYEAVEPKAERRLQPERSRRRAKAEIAEIHEAAPTSSGDRSLIRALGLEDQPHRRRCRTRRSRHRHHRSRTG